MLSRCLRPAVRYLRQRKLSVPSNRLFGSACCDIVDDGDVATDAQTNQALEHHVGEILKLLGEDPTRDGLLKTPSRVAKSLQFLTSGMERNGGCPKVAMGEAVFDENASEEMVLVRDIEVHSLCEHHMLPFMGRVHIAYIPSGPVLGLSKLARLSEVFGRRLQVQERLTSQIANALMDDPALAPRGVAVLMECTHMCMVMRGVEKAAATTITHCMLGDFKDNATLRSEYLDMISLPPLGERGSGHSSRGGKHRAHSGRCVLDNDSTGQGVIQSDSASSIPSTSLHELAHQDINSSEDIAVETTTISLAKQDMKFSAGHFTIFNGKKRERLHGHNFSVSAEITTRTGAGTREAGLVVDYGILKKALRELCDEWDEVFLLPERSPYLQFEQVSQDENQLRILFGDGKADSEKEQLVLPKTDVTLLPVSNITGEELSRLLLARFIEVCGEDLAAGGVQTVKIGVSSGPGQTVSATRSLNLGLPRAHSRGFASGSQQSRSFSTSSMDHTNANRSLVVTGGSSGIGLAVARKFGQAGWQVHNLSRRPIEEPWAVNHTVDLADQAELLDVSAALKTELGQATQPRQVSLVHAAGVHLDDSLQSVSEKDKQHHFARTMQVNVAAPALLTSQILPVMSEGSSVIYVGSTLSEIGVSGRLSYTASKHAVVGLMRASVQDLFGSGIHTACVCPGFTDTPMLDQALEDQLGLEGDALLEVRQSIANMCSFNRLVEPSEIADLIEFVSRNPALNGAVLHANLGQRQS